MASTFDGLNNISAIQANIESLKQAQSNSQAALNTTAEGTSKVDVNSYLLQTEKNFSSMLNALVGTDSAEKEESSSDIFSAIDSAQSSSLASLQNTADLQRLMAMEEYAGLTGKTVTYYDSATGAAKSGVIGQIKFADSGAALVVLQDGTQLPAGSVTGIK
jgi:hypothetical protein